MTKPLTQKEQVAIFVRYHANAASSSQMTHTT